MSLFREYVLGETFIVFWMVMGFFIGRLLVANAMRDVVTWITMGRLTYLAAFQLLPFHMRSRLA
jgi:hypothetical protein